MHHSGHDGSMADFNLEALSFKDLRQLQKDLAKAISTYEDRHKAEARAKLEAIAKEMGYSLAELMEVEVKTTRTPAAGKYRHPENAAVTWSGRGRKPQWFVDHINAGKAPRALAV
jgi:DNA-binding protein H-NS